MPMLIAQAGLPQGTPGRARRGLDTGDTVTLTDTTPGGATVFELLWVPLDDTTAVGSLAASEADSHVWTFEPTAGVTGAYRIQLTHTADNGAQTIQTLIFGIPDLDGNVPPAPGERSDPNATLLNATNPDVIARCERNWPTPKFPAGNPFGWGVDLKLGGGAPSGNGSAVEGSRILMGPAHTLEAGYRYLILGSQAPDQVTSIMLPDASLPGNAGRSITVSVGGDRFARFIVPSGNYFADERANVTGENLEPVLRGVYTFSAIYDAETYPIGLWLVQRHSGSQTRTSIDVDYVMPQPLPGGYSYEPVGNRLHRIVAHPESTEPLPIDGVLLNSQSSYPVGATVLVPFDNLLAAALYIVERDNGPADWSLKCIATSSVRPDGDESVAADSATEYLIRGGTQWKGRRFLQSSLAYVAGYELLPGTMSAYPQHGDLSYSTNQPVGVQPAGSSQVFSSGYKAGELLIGRVNKLDLSEPSETYSYVLKWPGNMDATRLHGERFAIIQSHNSGPHVQVSSGNSSIRMQAPGGGANGHFTHVLIEPNTYCEWQLDSYASVWRVVSCTSNEQVSLLSQYVDNVARRALPFSSGAIYGSITIWPGMVWRVVNAFDLTLQFTGYSLGFTNQRFGIKTANVQESRTITVEANAGVLLEADDGSLASTIVISQASRGFYREWMCDDEGIWRLLISS